MERLSKSKHSSYTDYRTAVWVGLCSDWQLVSSNQQAVEGIDVTSYQATHIIF